MSLTTLNKRQTKNPSPKKRSSLEKPILIQRGKDLSDVEDSDDFIGVISVLVKEAGKDALREAVAAGVPRTFVRGSKIVSLGEHNKQIVIKIGTGSDPKYFRKIKAGTVLHARKK